MKTKTNSPNDDAGQENILTNDFEDRHRKISEAAYFLSESQGFCGDSTLQNWLDAEVQINRGCAIEKPCG